MSNRAQFGIGEMVHHKLFDYRGVIVDVDPTFQSSDEWYELMARTRPPKDRPWYHVLVDDSEYMTYVSEQNLEGDPSGEPINHPEIKRYFDGVENGVYKTIRDSN